jgi:hypothetical protein
LINFDKLGNFLVHLFPNSSGHPGRKLPRNFYKNSDG